MNFNFKTSINLVIYNEGGKTKDINYIANYLQTTNNSIIKDARVVEKGTINDYSFVRLSGYCKFIFNYEIINALTKSFNVKWASMEENPVLRRFIINDEEDIFFENYMFYSVDSLGITNKHYKTCNEIIFDLKESGCIKKEKLEVIEEEMREALEVRIDEKYNVGLEFLDFNKLVEKQISFENPYHFVVYHYNITTANFWWSKEKLNTTENRIVELFDENELSSLYFETNAPYELINDAITYCDELRERETSLPSDEEIIKEYIGSKGFYFKNVEFECYYW